MFQPANPGSTVSSPCQHHGFHDITASPRTNGLDFDGAEDGSFGSIDLGGTERSVFFWGGKMEKRTGKFVKYVNQQQQVRKKQQGKYDH